MIRTEVKEDQITAALARVSTALTDMTPLMQDLGELMVERTRQNFREGSGPDGAAWAPKSPATLDAYRRRGDSAPAAPLIGPSRILSTTIAYEATATSVAWGSNAIQAAVMQFGATKGEFGQTARGSSIPWGNIPARPFLGVGDEDRPLILATIEEYLAGAAGED